MLLETDMYLPELQKSTQTQMIFGKLELGNISPGCYPKFCFIIIMIIVALVRPYPNCIAGFNISPHLIFFNILFLHV